MVSLLFFLDKYDFAKEHSLPVVAKKCLPSIFMNLFCWKSDLKKTKSVKLFAWQVEKKYVLLITQN
jgi:hypothetical protein